MSDFLNPAQNISYTNKDFQTIFPELLDLAKKLTSKWDPSISNESDPGVVLLKLNAIIADKLNYNIDKNVLECFPLSVTQEDNARKLFEQLGYRMHWYKSAITNVSLKWSGDYDRDNYVEIPAFTMVSDSENTVVYSLVGSPESVADDEFSVNSTKLPFNGNLITIKAIEGIAIKYDINGITTIKPNHLDDTNRLYFNTANVAENGIFITNVGANNYTSWQRKENLMAENLNNTYYSFGVSEDGSACYIEFPEDAENLIKDGIEITYIKSTGQDGNISVNTIEKFYNDVYLTDSLGNTVVLSDDNTNLYNYSSSTNGENPETINSAYSNYKRVVGTFDVLVTLRDYINYILRSGLVSNCFVCDRTNDIQCVYSIMTYDNELDSVNRVQEAIRVQKTLPAVGGGSATVYVEEPALSAFDIKLYLLEHVQSMGSYSDYLTSFKMLSNDAQQNIKYYLEDQKCISHDYADILPIDTQSAHICFFKNKYPITARITTKYALTSSQAQEVINNIRLAFYQNLNASKVEFSEEITIELINSLILSADERIKSAMIDNIEYITFAVYWDGIQFIEVPISPIPDDIAYEGVEENMISTQIEYSVAEYDPLSPSGYLVGDFCKYLGDRYICTVSMNAEPGRFNPNKWELDNLVISPYEDISDPQPNFDNSNVNVKIFINKIGFNNYNTYTFIYHASSGVSDPAEWRLNNNAVDLSEYGIDLDGTPQNNDKLIVKVSTASQIKDEIFAKSILAGVTPLYTQSEEFDYSYTHIYNSLEENVKKLTTNVTINFSNTNPSYKLKSNEYIQLYAPNLINGTTYSNYVKFEWNIGNDIQADDSYQLKENEYVIFYWKTDDDILDIYNYYVYAEGNIIKPSFTINAKLGECIGASLAAPDRLTEISDGVWVASTDMTGPMSQTISDLVSGLVARANILSGAKTVTIRKINSLNLSSSYYCYWVLNDEDDGKYTLFKEDEYAEEQSYILNTGEYFFYTNASLTELAVLGSGTVIRRNSAEGNWSVPATVDLEEILENGTTALNGMWVHPLYGQTVSVTENQFINVGPESTIELTRKDSSSVWSIGFNRNGVINPAANSLSQYNVKYKTSDTGEWVEVKGIDVTNYNYGWNARTLLSLNVGKDVPQRLFANQSITLEYDDESVKTINGSNATSTTVSQSDNTDYSSLVIPYYPVVLESLNTITFDGGGTCSVYSINDLGEIGYNKFYIYSELTSSVDKIYRVTTDGDVILTFKSYINKLKIPYRIPNGEYMTRMVNSSVEISSLTIQDSIVNTGSTETNYLYPIWDKTQSITDFASLSNIILYEEQTDVVDDTDCYLIVTMGSHTSDITITIYNPFKYKKPDYLDDFDYERLENKVIALDPEHVYNYMYQPNKNNIIENPLLATSFFETNHIYNDYVICEFFIKNLQTDLQVRGVK